MCKGPAGIVKGRGRLYEGLRGYFMVMSGG